MKKVLSISLSLVMLLAVLHFSVATHYCGGHIAASTISFSGKLATCGMEDDDVDIPQAGTFYHTHCCDNVLTFVGINNNYFPSFTSVPVSFHQHFQFLTVPACTPVISNISAKSFIANASPPGERLPNSVDLSEICTLLI
jgi:hypothetical protein